MPVRQRDVPKSFVVAGILLGGFIVAALCLPRAAEIFPARASFSEFPLQLGGWHGRASSLDGVYSEALKLDDYLLADYTDDSGNVVNLYIAYYNSQRKGEAAHSPRSCLPGGGWQMHDFGQRDMAHVRINGRTLRVNRTLIEMGDQRQLVYYWFQQRGRVITNEFAVKWYLFWDALTNHRTDGAMIRVITPLAPSAPPTGADARVTDLIAKFAPDLSRFVPN